MVAGPNSMRSQPAGGGDEPRADWQALIAQEQLPADYAVVVERWWTPLADAIAERARGREVPLIVGISGAQGSGKSTLCRFLELLLADQGLRAVTLSLDDFYLPRAQRTAMARQVHPLLATRGVPGTHDVGMLHMALDALLARRSKPLRVPRFDKASDDRLPDSQWQEIAAACDVVLLEGWCLGALAQDEAALAAPVNALERDEDASLVWRRFANDALAGPYAALFARFDLLIALLPPGFDEVRRNRALQESKLAAGSGPDRRMDEAALERFLAHYERITRTLLAQLPHSADFVVRLGRDHTVEAVDQR